VSVKLPILKTTKFRPLRESLKLFHDDRQRADRLADGSSDRIKAIVTFHNLYVKAINNNNKNNNQYITSATLYTLEAWFVSGI
jgi:hypothetical protein